MRALLLFVLGAMACSVAFAQDAQIFGLIRDPSNAAVAGADVALRHEQTGGTRYTISNESGLYSLPALWPGSYRLTVRAAGFQTTVREGIQLDVGENARIDFALSIGTSQTTITVRGGSPLLNTADASVGTVIDRNLIDQLPLNGRGIQTLAELTPGVVLVPVFDASRGQFVIDGQRSDANYFTVDGVSADFSLANSETLDFVHAALQTAGQAGGGMLPANNFLGTFSNLLSPEALEEFKIQTSTYAPEYGHLPGGQIDLISRSGGTRYSGSIFEYLRNDATDANDWFNDAQHLPKPGLRFNNFGGAFGGPIQVPHIYNGKDRTFFFFSVDILKIRQPQPAATMPVPTLSARQNAPPVLAPFLDAFPLPSNGAASGGNPATPGFAEFTGASSLEYDQRSYGLRVDHNFGDKVVIFARFSHAPSERSEPIALASTPSNIESYKIGTDSITVGITQTNSEQWVNDVRFNASRQSASDIASLDYTFGTVQPAISQFLPAGHSGADSEVGISVDSNLGPIIYEGLVSKNYARQIEALDNLSYSHGAHLLKFGFDYRWFSPVQIVPAYTAGFFLDGIYSATGAYTSTISRISTTANGSSKTAYVVPTFAAYAQDTWRLNPRFTINYGLRWEVAPAPRVSAGQALVAGGLTNLNDLSNVYLLSTGQQFYPTKYGNVAPRIGIGWQVFGRGQTFTAIRAGFGVFFDSAQGGFEDTPVNSTVISTYTGQPLGSIGTGTPSQSVDVGPAFAIAAAPNYKLPIAYQWNVSLEQAIGKQTFSVAYVGSAGRRLIGSVTLTFAPPPLPATSILGNDARSSYNSLQLQFNRRLSQRLQILTSYTFSHSIDDLSHEIESIFNFRSVAQYLNPSGNRGSSDFDIRHGLNGAVIAQLPAPHQGIAAALLRNWSANGIFFARTALPTDILDPFDLGLHPNYVNGQPLYLYGPQYPGGKSYNYDAFAHPQIAKEGDFPRNELRGFGAWQLDFAMHRDFELSQRARLEFRVEVFNLFNHPNFANPSDSGDPTSLSLLASPHWGQSSAMLANGLGPSLIPGELNPLFQIGGPRTMQLALRLHF
jgi:hypothetical protein